MFDMKIDSLFTGAEVVSVSPVYQYVDGSRTDAQAKNDDGIALWFVEVAVVSGAYILPQRIKVASKQAPTMSGQKVRFSGVEVNAWKAGAISFTAEGLENVQDQDQDELESLLGEGDS